MGRAPPTRGSAPQPWPGPSREVGPRRAPARLRPRARAVPRSDAPVAPGSRPRAPGRLAARAREGAAGRSTGRRPSRSCSRSGAGRRGFGRRACGPRRGAGARSLAPCGRGRSGLPPRTRAEDARLPIRRRRRERPRTPRARPPRARGRPRGRGPPPRARRPPPSPPPERRTRGPRGGPGPGPRGRSSRRARRRRGSEAATSVTDPGNRTCSRTPAASTARRSSSWAADPSALPAEGAPATTRRASRPMPRSARTARSWRRISGSRSSLFWRRGFARASITKSRAPMPSRVLQSTPSAVAEAARRPKSTPFHTVRHGMSIPAARTSDSTAPEQATTSRASPARSDSVPDGHPGLWLCRVTTTGRPVRERRRISSASSRWAWATSTPAANRAAARPSVRAAVGRRSQVSITVSRGRAKASRVGAPRTARSVATPSVGSARTRSRATRSAPPCCRLVTISAARSRASWATSIAAARTTRGRRESRSRRSPFARPCVIRSPRLAARGASTQTLRAAGNGSRSRSRVVRQVLASGESPSTAPKASSGRPVALGGGGA